LEFLGNVNGSERPQPAYCQFDSQRHPLHRPADVYHALLVFGQVEIPAYAARPIPLTPTYSEEEPENGGISVKLDRMAELWTC
jgi:hypothetical protein